MPNIITVTNTADSGVGSLREAIANAQSGDTIQFASNLANQQITLTSGQINITKSLTLDGSNAPNLKLSGNNSSRIILINKFLDVKVQNLTFVDGRAVVEGDGIGAGGAIQVRDYSNLTVENNNFIGNVAERGGAVQIGYGGSATVINSNFEGNDGSIANDGWSSGAISTYGADPTNGKGFLKIQGSTFTNNKGFSGGAVYVLLGPLTIEDSVFKNNEGIDSGGAVFTDGASAKGDGIGGDIIIRNSLFENNQTEGEGGGLFLWAYNPDKILIEDSTIIGNSVTKGGIYNNSKGGGIRVANGELTIRNTTIANNTAEQQGGGLLISTSLPVTIENSTISGNKVINDAGGGIFFDTPNGTPVKITNSTFANNYAGRDAGAIWTNRANSDDITLTNTLFAGNSAGVTRQGHTDFTLNDGGGNIVQIIPGGRGPKVTVNSLYVDDLKLGDLQQIGNHFVHPLLEGSPAIDAGTSIGVPSTDQTGATRPQDGDLNGSALVDVGAYEFRIISTPEIVVLNDSINITDGNTTPIDFGNAIAGDNLIKTFTIQNTGTAALNLSNLQLPTGFSLVVTLPTTVAANSSATFSVALDTATPGTYSGVLSFNTNDADESLFDFAINGVVNAVATPEIAVLNDSINITDGNTTPIDFGNAIAGGSLIKTFTIQNTGTAALNLSNLQLPTGFSLVGTLPTTVAANSSATFSVALDTATPGTYSGVLSFNTNDADESLFDFAINGVVNAVATPEIAVLNDSINITDGNTTPIDFGNAIAGDNLIKTFTIQNTGTAALNLSNLQLPTGFSLVGTLPTTVAANSSATFSVALDTATPGTYSGVLSFNTNDADESLFDFRINGVVNAVATPEIAVFNDSINITDGNPTPIDFGNAIAGDNLIKTFTIQNTGTAALNLSNLQLPTGFSLVETLPTTVAANSSANFSVALDTTTPGTYSGVLSFNTNDADESLFDFRINGVVNAIPINNLPILNIPVPDQATDENTLFSYTLEANTFTDVDSDSLTFTAKLADGSSLPSWLSFDPTNRTFSGTPTNVNIGAIAIEVTALDGKSGSIQDTFTLTVREVLSTILNGTELSETIVAAAPNNQIKGFGGQDMITGGSGNDQIWGGEGHDRLWGHLGNDLFYGEDGNDQISGDDGDDSLFGGNGDDLLYGGAGNDWLDGGVGKDVLTGGYGVDTFVLASAQGIDSIRDFELGVDKIGLSGSLQFGQISILQRGSQAWIIDGSQRQILAQLDAISAVSLLAEAANSFITMG